MKRLRVSILGLGPHGRRVLKAVEETPGLVLDAIVDRREDVLSGVQAPAHTRRYPSADTLWADGRPELVCIATNGPSHADLAVAAMKAGATHVMVEKPMATSLADCDRIIAEAERWGARLSVDQSRRHDPFYRWLRDTIRAGDLGSPRAMWVQRPGTGLGCLATHSFDLIEFLLGAKTNRVVGWIDEPIGENPRGREFVDPGGTVIMDMGPGLRGVVSQIEDGAGPMSVEVDLSAGRVRIDESTGEVEIVRRDLSVKPGPGRPPKYERLAPPKGMSAKVNMFTMLRGVLNELAFGEPSMECGPEQGRRAVEILVAAHQSARRGNIPVELPLVSTEEQTLCLPVT